MDRSIDISRMAMVRRLFLPRVPSPPTSVSGRAEFVAVFIPVQPPHRSRLEDLATCDILELFPISRGLPLPSVSQAQIILQKNFPPPVWQSSWDPLPFSSTAFLVWFISRLSLLQAYWCGVLWGRRFSCSIRPWSFKEGGSPHLLSTRIFLRLSQLSLLLRDSASISQLVSGFGLLTDPMPDLDILEDLSSIDIAVLVEAVEDVPKAIFVTFEDGQYEILVNLRGTDPFSPASPAFSPSLDGEPD